MSKERLQRNVTFDHQGETTTARLPGGGISSLEQSDPVLEQFERAISVRRPRHLIIDLTDVTFLGTAGMTMLVVVLKRVRTYDGEVYLCGLSESVRSVFTVSRLDTVLPILPNQAAVLAAVDARR